MMCKCLQIMSEIRLCFKNLYHIKVSAFAWYSVKLRVIFDVRLERRKVTSKPTWKLNHANSYARVFRIFLSMSSKSIVKILNYTVSKLVHFFLRQCNCAPNSCIMPLRWQLTIPFAQKSLLHVSQKSRFADIFPHIHSSSPLCLRDCKILRVFFIGVKYR